MGYIVATGGNTSGRYYLTDTCNKPRIAVKISNSISYMPMKTTTSTIIASVVEKESITSNIYVREYSYKPHADNKTSAKSGSHSSYRLNYFLFDLDAFYNNYTNITTGSDNYAFYTSYRSINNLLNTNGNETAETTSIIRKYQSTNDRTITPYAVLFVTRSTIYKISNGCEFVFNHVGLSGAYCKSEETKTSTESYGSNNITYSGSNFTMTDYISYTLRENYNLATFFGGKKYLGLCGYEFRSLSFSASTNLRRTIAGYNETNKSHTLITTLWRSISYYKNATITCTTYI